MKQADSILILKTFSENEIRQFEDYLNSPFHNKNKKVVEFFSILRKYHPFYNPEDISKENLFREMHLKEKYRESYIRNLFSDLNLLCEGFLQQIHARENYAGGKMVIEELNKRNIFDVMEKKIRILEKKAAKEKNKDNNYYSNKVFIYEAKSFLLVDKTLTDNFRNDQMLCNLKLFLINMMELYFYLIVEEQRVKIKHDFEFLNLLLNYVKNNINDFTDSPLLMIYYNLCRCFIGDQNDEEYYFASKKLFQRHFKTLHDIDRKNIYSMFQTFCSNKIDKGFDNYNKELLNILIEMLKQNILSHKGNSYIDLNLYRNIIVLCVTLRQTSVLRDFIHKYLKLSNPESREDLSVYSYAHLEFLQKNYEKTLMHCAKIDFNDLLSSANENLYFKNDIRKLIMFSLYELNSNESALSHIDAYKHFLKSSKLIKDDLRNRFNQFLNFVNELIKLRLRFDEYKILKLKEKIQMSTEIMNKGWLLEKLNELEKNKV
ncbi:MAG TPA: hypothetical protein PKA90_11720 [Ignavibacteria bacterium]|nr:hypothetical protein [Ignavibacteria bacterium]HMR41087.1 hypothetical protein [Ignavibacteria bacterium]